MRLDEPALHPLYLANWPPLSNVSLADAASRRESANSACLVVIESGLIGACPASTSACGARLRSEKSANGVGCELGNAGLATRTHRNASAQESGSRFVRLRRVVNDTSGTGALSRGLDCIARWALRQAVSFWGSQCRMRRRCHARAWVRIRARSRWVARSAFGSGQSANLPPASQRIASASAQVCKRWLAPLPSIEPAVSSAPMLAEREP